MYMYYVGDAEQIVAGVLNRALPQLFRIGVDYLFRGNDAQNG